MPRSVDFPNGVEGHVVSMTLDHSGDPSLSVATCKCGKFQNKVEWRPENHVEQDRAIEAHWRDVAAPSRTLACVVETESGSWSRRFTITAPGGATPAEIDAMVAAEARAIAECEGTSQEPIGWALLED